VKTYGIAQSIEMCEAMRARGTKGFHIYTLNLEISATAIIKGLGLYSEEKAVRRLPWRPATSSSARSTDETVRPIFWANRPRSFLARTMDWNDFQNGRWGNNQSQVFGDLNDHYLARLDRTSRDKDGCIKLWGSPTSIADINRIFSRFATGEIDRLPWSEKPGGLEAESSLLSQRLHDLNEKGVLTVNSQPTVNGVASTDPAVGWGGPGGVVYQKGYIEFFASAETTAKIVAACRAIPSLTFQATNTSGDCQTNIQPDHPVNAVTWGVFPQREIMQPTVVDAASFMIWKDEAFGLWKMWSGLYGEDSESARVLEEVHSTYWLMNIVENDFVNGDVFKAFDAVDWG